ncbi:MAG: hypothetical protein U9O65_08005 [Thermotogota bacterium]|nr:hypothetical protein [Thermotogota bacterium]
MATKKVPRGALRVLEMGEGCNAFTEFFGEGDEKKPKLKMTAYSGGIIKDHWYWGDLALDLSGMKFNAKFPILENHDTNRKIAFTDKPILSNGRLEINPDTTKFVDTEVSAEFQKLSAEGFPYQSSVYANPTVVERLSSEDASVEVNGITLKGPGTVFREWELKEASVCVFGWDSKTNATAFSKEEVEIDMEENEILAQEEPEVKLKLRKKEVTTMTKEELLEKHPELVEEIQLEAKKESEVEFAKKETEFSKKEEDLKSENEKLTDRTLELEKKEAIRAENELRKSADSIWTKKLSESDIPETLFEKVRQYVSHVKFTEEGILNVEKFGEAVNAEIKDWESRGVTSKVIGAGFTEKTVDETELAKTQKGIDDDVNMLRKKVGEKPLEEK